MEITRQCTPAELERVMETYGNTVYRLAYAQLRSTADADDVYQEVFLRYFQRRPRFESEEHRKAWLIRVTINRAKSFATSPWKRHNVSLEDRVVFQQEDVKELDEALGCLEEKDRTLLHLFYYEQLSTRDIAKLLNRKESTIRTQLTRARKRLGTILKGEEYGEIV